MGKKKALVTLTTALAIAILGFMTQHSYEIVNPDFELGWVPDNFYWTPSGGPYSNVFNEVRTPEGWIGWWYEGFPCATAYTFVTGRPESLLFTDPTRVYSGTQAVKMFTFYRCHEMGLMQHVQVVPGRYIFSIYAHSWYTNCSTKPFDPPLAKNCKTGLSAWDKLKVGIDPDGGIDPHASSVVWGNAVEQYGVYGRALIVTADVEEAGIITVFVSSLADNPLKHNDIYLDTALLWKIEATVYIPLALGETP